MIEKIGIYGGSFSPPHKGHREAARRFFRAAGLDRLLVIPAFAAPNKHGVSTASPLHRLEMAKIAFSGMEFPCEVSSMEIERGGVSYTVDTLEKLARPDRKLFLLCGSDMLLDFENWHCYRDILRLAELYCVRRENDPAVTAQMLPAVERLVRDCGAKIHIVTEDPADFSSLLDGLPEEEKNGEAAGRLEVLAGQAVELSSTELRGQVGESLSSEGLVPGVAEYIRFFELYRPREILSPGPDELAALRGAVSERLSEKRMRHVLGVEQTAAELGEIFCPEAVPELRAAALLHDFTKELPAERQLQMYRDCAIISPALFQNSDFPAPDTLAAIPRPLWHGITAAARIPAEFPRFAESRIVSAVRWHTTGRADMTLFELLICLSDFIEPGRQYERCQALRRRLYDGLSEKNCPSGRLALLLAVSAEMFSQTLEILANEGLPIAGETRDSLAWCREEYQKIYGVEALDDTQFIEKEKV